MVLDCLQGIALRQIIFSNGGGIAALATGLGKTDLCIKLVAHTIARMHKENVRKFRFLFVVHRIGVLTQALLRFKKSILQKLPYLRIRNFGQDGCTTFFNTDFKYMSSKPKKSQIEDSNDSSDEDFDDDGADDNEQGVESEEDEEKALEELASNDDLSENRMSLKLASDLPIFLFASASSLKRHLNLLTNVTFNIVAYDEVHHNQAGGWKKVAAHFAVYKPKDFYLGLTATPFRTDGKDVSDVFPSNLNTPYCTNWEFANQNEYLEMAPNEINIIATSADCRFAIYKAGVERYTIWDTKLSKFADYVSADNIQLLNEAKENWQSKLIPPVNRYELPLIENPSDNELGYFSIPCVPQKKFYFYFDKQEAQNIAMKLNLADPTKEVFKLSLPDALNLRLLPHVDYRFLFKAGTNFEPNTEEIEMLRKSIEQSKFSKAESQWYVLIMFNCIQSRAVPKFKNS